MQVLISDANVIIDVEDGGLTEAIFSLPYQFAVPDILYYEELEMFHPELLDMGLEILELPSEIITNAETLLQSYSNPSRNDCLALAAAIQENCPLVTGDMALRKAAKSEHVEVRGTLWLVEETVAHGLVTKVGADAAFQQMKEAGSRLPWDEVDKLLEKF